MNPMAIRVSFLYRGFPFTNTNERKMPEFEQNPKFAITRLDNTIMIAVNLPMGGELLDILDDFEDLNPHEYAMREQLRTILNGRPVQTRVRRRHHEGANETQRNR